MKRSNDVRACARDFSLAHSGAKDARSGAERAGEMLCAMTLQASADPNLARAIANLEDALKDLARAKVRVRLYREILDAATHDAEATRRAS